MSLKFRLYVWNEKLHKRFPTGWRRVDITISGLAWWYRMYVRTLPVAITILALVALMIILIIDLWLINIPEYFPSGAVLGQVLYRICLSIVASFVFFVILHHRKGEKDKRHVNPIVYHRSKLVVESSARMLSYMQKKAHLAPHSSYPDRSTLLDMCRRIKTHEPVTSFDNLRRDDILGVLDLYATMTAKALKSLFDMTPFLSAEHIAILGKIDDAKFLQSIELYQTASIVNENLEFLVDELHAFLSVVHDLDCHNNQKLAPYDREKYSLDQLLSD